MKEISEKSVRLNMNDLDGVAGGNYNETAEIINAIDNNPNLSSIWYKALDNVHGIEDEDVDVIAAQNVLATLGIKANMDFRTAKNNNYGGMSHAEVLKRIKGYKK